MTFLAPLFLAGLAALAVPVIVHLTNRPQREAYAFPSLMFLQQVPFRSVRRQRIRHWWLLAIRAGLVALLAGAFARPLLERWSGAAAFTAGQEVVILLDNSYSMRYGDRWQRAMAAARRAVEGLGPEDQASVVVFASGALSLGQATSDHATLLAALTNAAPGFGATHYAAGLQLARDLLEQSRQPRRRVVLISDFQRAGWRPEEAVRMPAGTAVELVSLAGAAANVGVTGLAVERTARGPREEATVSARVVNLGNAARRGLRVALEVDGRPVQTRTLSLDVGGSGAAVFAALPLTDRAARVVAKADPDGLPVDDVQYAVLAPGDVVRVLFLSPGGAARQASFVRQALEVRGSPRFEVATGSRLAGYQLVILADVPPGPAALAASLSDFVRRGGGVLVLLAERAGVWGPGWRDLLGGAVGGTVESASASGTALAGLRYDHPVFEPFRAPKSGDFGATRVYRYRRFTPDSGAVVLASYEDGAPALVEHRTGKGKVLVWTSGLDNLWSDLPVQPVFLPLVHQMARYLAGYAERETAFPVGYVLDLDAARRLVGGDADVSVENPSGQRVALGAGAEPAVRLDAPGFYTVRAVGEGVAPASVAVNLDPSEGDLAPLDLESFLAAARPTEAPTPEASPANAAISRAARERRQGLWWYLVIGAAILALAETLLSNRLPAVASRRA